MARGIAIFALAAALAGCISPFGGDLPARNWYELTDLRGDVAPQVRSADGTGLSTHSLLIAAASANSFYDTTAIAFSREAGSRAHYHYAGWTERPVKRIGHLVERRLIARGAFDSVSQATSGIRGDWLLNLRLEEIYLDAVQPPGVARLRITAELLDWRERSVISRHTFVQAVPVEQEAPAAAVVGFNRALSNVIDELVAWIETAGARKR